MRVSPRAKSWRNPTRLRGPRQIEIIQPCDHFAPVGPPPVHATTGGTTPEYPVPGADSFRHELLHVLQAGAQEDLVAQRTPGQRIDEAEWKGRCDLANLVFQNVRPNLDSAGDPGGEFLVPRQEDPILGANALDESSIRSWFRIGRVVAHEPQPAGETPKHVIAEEFHAAPLEITSTSKRRARLFAARNRGASKPAFHSLPPSSSETTRRLAVRRRRCRATAHKAAASISTATTPRRTT